MIDLNYYKNLPRKYMAVGVLFFNEENQILLVNPTYKDNWEIPGGVVELNESLGAAAQREIEEELGFKISITELLCADYCESYQDKGDNIQFIFYGGILTKDQIAAIKLQAEELSEYRFFDVNNIDVNIKDKLRFRIQESLKALEDNKAVYIENPYN